MLVSVEAEAVDLNGHAAKIKAGLLKAETLLCSTVVCGATWFAYSLTFGKSPSVAQLA